MNKIILHCKDIVKTFGSGESEVFALRGVTLDVYKGELLMLVGPSGCGKTTFVSVITALLSFDSGICDVLGDNLSTMSEEEKVHFRGKSVGFVFQAFNLLPSLTALENVALPLHVIGMSREEVHSKVDGVLDKLGLTEKSHHLPHQLSGGEQQIVSLARAIVKDPIVVLADEPTGNLDPAASFKILKLLEAIQKSGTAVLMATHNYNLVKDRNYRFFEIIKGQVRISSG